MSTCKVSTMTAQECATQLVPIYDHAAHILMNSDIRKGVVQNGGISPFLALQMDLTEKLTMGAGGKSYRTVETQKYYTQESCCVGDDWTFSIKGNNSQILANEHTVIVAGGYAGNGGFSTPIAGRRATISYQDGTSVNTDIISVDVQTNGSHLVTLRALNGKLFSLNSQNTFKVIMGKLKPYVKNDTKCIETHGMVQNGVNLVQGHIQKYEDGLCILEDEVDFYKYSELPMGEQGAIDVYNPATQQFERGYNPDTIFRNQLYNNRMQNMTYEMLFGEYNAVTDTGIDGVWTTIQKRGMFKFNKYNLSDPAVLKSILRIIVRQLKSSGLGKVKEVCIWQDDIASSKTSDSIMKILGFTENYIPQATGFNVNGKGELEWYNFTGIKNFEGSGISFSFKNLGIQSLNIPHMRDFCIIQPMVPFKDSMGNSVAPIEITKLKNLDGINKSIWMDDSRERGCRKISYFVKDSFGLDIHCAQFMGYIKG